MTKVLLLLQLHCCRGSNSSTGLLGMRQLAQRLCRRDDITGPICADALLLALTPAFYSSNNTADTPGRRAFISPAQVKLLQCGSRA
jgi:hypothetical protein